MGLRESLASAIAPKEPGRPKQYWTARGFIGTAADVLAVLSPVVAGVAFFVKGSFPEAVFATTLSVLALVFLAFTFRLQRRFAHESRRAQAGRVTAKCHAHLRDAVIAVARNRNDEFAVHFYKASQALAEAFGIATRGPCRVAVQDIGVGHTPQTSRVKTLCRSDEPEDDSREAGLPEFAVVEENTDFLRIIEGDDVFFSNDLANESNYKNSHFDFQLKPHQYPYRSTIVWPIKGPPTRGTSSRSKIIGFLCVDAEDPGRFVQELDVPVGRAVAHAMYSSLSLYRERQETRGHKAREQGPEQ